MICKTCNQKLSDFEELVYLDIPTEAICMTCGLSKESEGEPKNEG